MPPVGSDGDGCEALPLAQKLPESLLLSELKHKAEAQACSDPLTAPPGAACTPSPALQARCLPASCLHGPQAPQATLWAVLSLPHSQREPGGTLCHRDS